MTKPIVKRKQKESMADKYHRVIGWVFNIEMHDKLKPRK